MNMLTALLLTETKKYSDDQPRDQDGKWSSGGALESAANKASSKASKASQRGNHLKAEKLHLEAAHAHKLASVAFRGEGNKSKEIDHMRQAHQHEAQADAHRAAWFNSTPLGKQ